MTVSETTYCQDCGALVPILDMFVIERRFPRLDGLLDGHQIIDARLTCGHRMSFVRPA